MGIANIGSPPGLTYLTASVKILNPEGEVKGIAEIKFAF